MFKVVKLRLFNRTCGTCGEKIPRGSEAVEEHLGYCLQGFGGFTWYHIGHDPETLKYLAIARDNLVVSDKIWAQQKRAKKRRGPGNSITNLPER